MITVSEGAFLVNLASKAHEGNLNLGETDLQGQIVIYTGWFRWSDGSIRNEVEPEMVDDLTDA